MSPRLGCGRTIKASLKNLREHLSMGLLNSQCGFEHPGLMLSIRVVGIESIVTQLLDRNYSLFVMR